MRRRIASSQPPSAVGFSRSTGGSNSSTLPNNGRDTVKLPQIMVESGFARAAVTNDAKTWRRSIDVQNPQRLGPAIRIKHMGLAARDDDKIALGHVELLSLFEREGRRAATEIMKQSVGARRQRQTPGMAELEVKEQRPAKANAIEHLGEYIHVARC